MFTAVFAENKLRLAFGLPAEENEFPYLVSLLNNGEPLCGASLISDRHVLTAAHCVYNITITGDPQKVRSLSVGVGSNNVLGGIQYGVKKITYHPDFKHILEPNILPNDVAIILVIFLKYKLMIAIPIFIIFYVYFGFFFLILSIFFRFISNVYCSSRGQ